MPPARRSRVKVLEDEEEEESVDLLDQTLEEKREVRKKIQDITEALEEYRKQGDKSMLQDGKFGEILQEAKQLTTSIKNPQAYLEDTRLFYNLCRLFNELSCSLDGNEQKFLASEYCALIARSMQATGESAPFRPSKTNIVNFGRRLSNNFSHAPTINFVLGTLNTEAVGGSQSKRVKKKAAANRAKEKAPTLMSTVGKHQTVEALTDNYVKQTRKCLEQAFIDNNKQPVCYFSFVIDPDEFGRTVENMFHVSFLVRQRTAELSIGEKGLPVLVPKMKKERRGRVTAAADTSDSDQDEDDPGDGSSMDQAVIDFCYADWVELKANLKIKKKMITIT